MNVYKHGEPFVIPFLVSERVEIKSQGNNGMPVAVLYSAEQDAFHIEEIAQTLQINVEQMANKLTDRETKPNDYKAVAIMADYEEAMAFCRAVRKEAEVREKHREYRED